MRLIGTDEMGWIGLRDRNSQPWRLCFCSGIEVISQMEMPTSISFIESDFFFILIVGPGANLQPE
jgi:hypothetical protein